MGPLDATINFAKATVSTGYAAGVTSITLAAGGGARFPAVDFNAVWWNSTDYSDPADDPTVEIVRVTAIVGDVLTITRAQEGTADVNHNTAGKTYKLIEGITSSQMDIISEAFAVTAANLVWAGPASGAAAAPGFRALTAADVPFAAPGGPDRAVQFNNAGAFGGSADLQFNPTNITGMTGLLLGDGTLVPDISVACTPNNLSQVRVGSTTVDSTAIIANANVAYGTPATGDVLGTYEVFFAAYGTPGSPLSPQAQGVRLPVWFVDTYVWRGGGWDELGVFVEVAGPLDNGAADYITLSLLKGPTASGLFLTGDGEIALWSGNFGMGFFTPNATRTEINNGSIGSLIDVAMHAVIVDSDTALPFVMKKTTQPPAAPGAGYAVLRWEAGTLAGTAKLVGYAGTSATGVTIVDNVGAGF